MSSKSLTTSSDKLNLVHAEYVSNGFNGTKAVQEVYKDMNYQSARVYFNTIKKTKDWYKIVSSWRQDLANQTGLDGSALVNELKGIAFADIKDFVGLNTDQFKELPSELTRKVKKFKSITKTYTTREGQEVTEQHTDIELKSGLTSMEMLAKHLGIYEADNRQKQPVMNVNDALSKIDNEDDKKEFLRAIITIQKHGQID